jgi:hypothetical protein
MPPWLSGQDVEGSMGLVSPSGRCGWDGRGDPGRVGFSQLEASPHPWPGGNRERTGGYPEGSRDSTWQNLGGSVAGSLVQV